MERPTIPPPHPAPRAPRLRLPAGACDAHCHVFGPAHRFPFASDRRYTPPDAGFEALRSLHDRLGLDTAVVVQASCHGTDNSAVLDALRRGEGRYAGVAMLDDRTTEAELDELDDAGVRGARVNFVQHLGGAPDPVVFRRHLARIAARGWHVVLHFDARDLVGYRALLDEIPVPFVIDHMGRVDVSAGLDQPAVVALLDLQRDERCWIKVSGAERVATTGRPPYDDVVPVARALVDAAPERILWGTDWPHPNVRHVPDDGDMVDLLERIAPDPAVRNRILVDNPRVLYDLT